MATTTNYGWTTPDDTALVKDGAAAIRTLGSSVDTTTKNLNPSTTLGDIEYRSSTANTNTRLGIGSTGQVLTVAAGVPSWAAPAGGGANWTLLNSGGTALTGAQTITISGISTKNQIMVIYSGASDVNGGGRFGIRLNTDTGSNYYQYGTTYQIQGSYSTSDPQVVNESRDYFRMGRVQSAGNSASGYLMISGCNASGLKMVNGVGGATGENGAGTFWIGGYYNSASTISSVSMYAENANFDAGTVYIYATE